jgi:hypothetical protein
MSASLAPKKPVPPPAAVGAPKEKAPKEKKAKVAKIDFPALYNAAGEWNKLEALPDDTYNPKVHKLLKKKDFKDEPLYLEFLAAGFEKKATSLKAQAEKIRKLGSSSSNAKLKTLIKMQERMAELMATLRAEGIDVDAHAQ